jgi:rhodanese-related sulfurtransferase
MRFATYSLKRDPKCCSCHNPSQWQIHPRPFFDTPNTTSPDEELRELSARDFWNYYQVAPDPWLIDVRTPAEYEHENLGGTNVPLEELLKQLALQHPLFDHPNFDCNRNSTIFVYCQKGRRSAKAVAALQAAGYRAVSLQGGIETVKG